MKHLVSLIIYFTLGFFQFEIKSQSFPLKISRRVPSSDCEQRVKVRDARPSNCNFNGNNYLYPVFVEEFNFKADLPNNWEFKQRTVNDEDWEGTGKGNIWMGNNPFNNGNIYTVDGIGYTEVIKLSNPISGHPSANLPSKNYYFTGGFFKSIFNLRQGVFEARIKFPNDPNFFDAFWLQSNAAIDQEIDICEFFDQDISNHNTSSDCDTYHQMKMTMHNRSLVGNLNCKRSRKFGVSEGGSHDFHDAFHVYKCVWTDYRVDFYLDGTLVGYAYRYYDGPYYLSGICENHGAGWLPWSTKSCTDMANDPECLSRIWLPDKWWRPFGPGHYECIMWNKVDVDMAFPSTNNKMNLILNSVTNYHNQNYGNNLFNNWPTNINNRRMAVDWVKVYQPVECGASRQVNTLNDVKNITGSTNFLSGSSIKIGSSSNATSFQNTMSEYYAGNEFPLHILATDQIEINGEAIFEEGTHLRAEIIDCSGGFNENQRTLPGGGQLFLTDTEIHSLEQQQIDSLLAANPSLQDSLIAYRNRDLEPLPIIDTSSIVNSLAVLLLPNPATNVLHISMDEEDFNDIMSMEILSPIQAPQAIPVSASINISALPDGLYQLRIILNQGYVVVKPFIKAP